MRQIDVIKELKSRLLYHKNTLNTNWIDDVEVDDVLYIIARIESLEIKCRLQSEYISLIGDELTELAVMASNRGWKSTRVEEGERLRNEIVKYDETKEETQPPHP